MQFYRRRPVKRQSGRAFWIGTFICLFSGVLLFEKVATFADEPAPAFSEEVVAKADAILKEAQLRRSGKGLQFLGAADLSREISGLTRQRRELRLKHSELENAEQTLQKLDQAIVNLNRTDRDLNLNLAQVAGGDVVSNNRIVALINATRNQVTETKRQIAAQTALIKSIRGSVNEAEAAYAENVFQSRKSLDQIRGQIEKQLSDSQVRIAIDVMHRNFEVPSNITASDVLRSLEFRLTTFEKEVFRDTIELEVGQSGSLFAMVSVNNQPVRMVVDSGATLVTIPANTAAELKLVVPADASVVNLALANGERITGRRIQIESLRVGEFEAKDVEAVVLEPIAANAQPLLGLSYLDRYKFEINPTAKTLGLLSIAPTE